MYKVNRTVARRELPCQSQRSAAVTAIYNHIRKRPPCELRNANKMMLIITVAAATTQLDTAQNTHAVRCRRHTQNTERKHVRLGLLGERKKQPAKRQANSAPTHVCNVGNFLPAVFFPVSLASSFHSLTTRQVRILCIHVLNFASTRLEFELVSCCEMPLWPVSKNFE